MRPERRAGIAEAVVKALRTCTPGSEVRLRGSLATGEADRFSDIDLLWTVPADRLDAAVASVPETLTGVAPVGSLRADPDVEHSPERRLLFIRLEGIPLFWRIDLEVRASAVDEGEVVPRNAPAMTTEWSLAASAVANGVAAIKAVSRGHLVEANGLLQRGFVRVGETVDPDEGWAAAVVRLARSAAAADPAVAELADEVAQLAVALLSTHGHPTQSDGSIVTPAAASESRRRGQLQA